MGQRTKATVTALAVVVFIGTAACGDDDEDAVTHEEWFAQVCERTAGVDPGFDQFFQEHPDPTLEDWAAFLATPSPRWT